MARGCRTRRTTGLTVVWSFAQNNLEQRVRFATGGARAAIAEEIARLGATRVVVIAGAQGAMLAREVLLDVEVAATVDNVVMHTPVAIAEAARQVALEAGADLLVSVGGGSTTGLAKAVALALGTPILAVPTTYAGSEATPVWGLTEAARKTTGVDRRVLPRVVVYDAALTTTLPVGMSISSGLNAVAHCVDALWAPNANPINAVLAQEGIRAAADALPRLHARPWELDGRERMLYAAYLAAAAFAAAGSGLHHKICHVLGGRYDLPHAQTHAVVLPHVLAYNRPHAVEQAARVAAALGVADAVEGLTNLTRGLGAPTTLRELGMPGDDLATAAAAIVAVAPSNNPTPITADTIARLLEAAWKGAEPA